MLDAPTSAETKASSSPKEELESLVSLVAALSQMSLDITKHCLDVQTRLPGIVDAVIAAGVAAQIPPPPTWVSGIARTPDELEAAHPATEDDDSQVLHVVTVGREPGLYATRPIELPGQWSSWRCPPEDARPGRCPRLLSRQVRAAHEVEKLVPAPDPAPAPSADV